MKPRVLHVIDHTGAGGAQVVVLNLLRTLNNRFSQAVAVLGASGMFSESYAEQGIPVFALGSPASRWNPFSIVELCKTIRQEQFDLIHTHLFKSNILGTWAARSTGCKTILHDHTGIYPQSLEHYMPGRLLRWSYMAGYRAALKSCDRAIVLTPEMLSSYREFYHKDAHKTAMIPNAVDLNQYAPARLINREGALRSELGLPAETKLVVMIGRLEPEKDWGTFLGVAQELQRRSGCRCAFLAIGSGSEADALGEQARARGLDNVFFSGYRRDVPLLLGQADIFLLTSRREPFGIVVLEAMAAGCPVVTTRSGGPQAIITDGVDGLLGEVGDVVGLADCVIRLLHEDGLADRLTRQASRTVADRFGLEAVAAQIAAMYEEVLG